MGTQNRIALARYNMDGSLDTTFGNGGKTITQVTAADNASASRIVGCTVFSTILADWYYTAFVRYLPDGTLDNTFGTNGISIDESGGGVKEMKIQSDSKMITLGLSLAPMYVLHRYQQDGMRDIAYGNLGSVGVVTPNADTYVGSIELLDDDRLVVLGLISDQQSNNSLTLFKHLPSGAFDLTFGNGGKVMHSVGQISPIEIRVQDDDKLVFGAMTYGATDWLYTVGRFNANGTFDPTFGTNGTTTTDVTPTSDIISAIALQDDGKLIAVGKGDCMALTRYTRENLSDKDFSTNHLHILAYPNPATDAFSLAYELKKEETVSIIIHDLYGRCISKPVSEQKQTTGKHIETIHLSGFSAGTYLIALQTSDGKQLCKIIKSN